MTPSLPQALLLSAVVFVMLVPPMLVLLSERSRGAAKVGWVVATCCLSWLAYAIFLACTRPRQRPSTR